MAISLVTQYLPYVDELFTTESKKSLLTNQDLSWTGAHTIKVYKVTTAGMNDYGRSGPVDGNWSRSVSYTHLMSYIVNAYFLHAGFCAALFHGNPQL